MKEKKAMFWKLAHLLLAVVPLLATSVLASRPYDPTIQSQELLYHEAQTVYLGNVAREQEAGVPPLRWNRQLTHGARWFSWDSVENRPGPYCGHQDTTGGWPGDRALTYGYLGGAGAENAYCGYVTPEEAISGWLDSPGHRANLLSPDHREIGLGYYWRESDGRGYVAQPFGHDAVYPPVVIENEAIATTNERVNLYIYDRSSNGGFAGLAPATEMLVGNDRCFTASTWEPYAARKSWGLAPGDGWKSVYVKTRDAFGRTITVADSIYLGANVPLDELGPEQMSTTESQVTLYDLGVDDWQRIQLSLGWLADDGYGTFKKWWGNGESVNDATAWGGTAYRLYPGDGESFAWVYDTSFTKNTPFVAYFRLKVSDNSSPNEVARISVKGGGTEYGPVILKGTDFTAANQYQEFAIPFTFHDTNDVFLFFNFWRSGQSDLYVDAVLIFTPPQPVTSPLAWQMPGRNYRGQGVWVRYTNTTGEQFSNIVEADTTGGALTVSPTKVTVLAVHNGVLPAPVGLMVAQACGAFTWEVSDDVGWLEATVAGNEIALQVNQAGLDKGVYEGRVVITAVNQPDVGPVSVRVQLLVADEVSYTYLPVVRK